MYVCDREAKILTYPDVLLTCEYSLKQIQIYSTFSFKLLKMVEGKILFKKMYVSFTHQ